MSLQQSITEGLEKQPLYQAIEAGANPNPNAPGVLVDLSDEEVPTWADACFAAAVDSKNSDPV